LRRFPATKTSNHYMNHQESNLNVKLQAHVNKNVHGKAKKEKTYACICTGFEIRWRVRIVRKSKSKHDKQAATSQSAYLIHLATLQILVLPPPAPNFNEKPFFFPRRHQNFWYNWHFAGSVSIDPQFYRFIPLPRTIKLQK
jgi:hypothetical protein